MGHLNLPSQEVCVLCGWSITWTSVFAMSERTKVMMIRTHVMPTGPHPTPRKSRDIHQQTNRLTSVADSKKICHLNSTIKRSELSYMANPHSVRELDSRSPRFRGIQSNRIRSKSLFHKGLGYIAHQHPPGIPGLRLAARCGASRRR